MLKYMLLNGKRIADALLKYRLRSVARKSILDYSLDPVSLVSARHPC